MTKPFDNAFLASVPEASISDTRYLPCIKKYAPHHLELLNKWYEKEVAPTSHDPDLIQRLRNVEDSEAFLGAYWELIVLRFLRTNGHNVSFQHRAGEKVPDLFWPEPKYYGDVISVSDPAYVESDERQLQTLMHTLENRPPPFRVYIKTTELHGKQVDIPKMAEAIRTIQPKLEGDEHADLTVTDGATQLQLIAYPLNGHDPSVSRFLGELDSDGIAKRLDGRLREKKKYPEPIIVFACPGRGFWAMELDVVERALYGQQMIVFPLQEGAGKAYSDRRANGFFYNLRKDGLPANSGVSAVVWVGRSSKTESKGIGVVIRIFHNPFAKHRLPLSFFGDVPQYHVAEESHSKIQMKLINKECGVVEVL